MAKIRKAPKPRAFKNIPKGVLASVSTPLKNPKVNYPTIEQFLGPRTTASSAAEGRLKIASRSKYKEKLKAAIKKKKK